MLPKQRTERGLFQISVLRTTERVDDVCGLGNDGGSRDLDDGLGVAVRSVADGVIVTEIRPTGPVGRNGHVRWGQFRQNIAFENTISFNTTQKRRIERTIKTVSC
jgi:hypothetical protein